MRKKRKCEEDFGALKLMENWGQSNIKLKNVVNGGAKAKAKAK
jgi:hypothetical protein